MKEWQIQNRRIILKQGNIVDMEVDAIVNAANKSLLLGSGVAGAIRRFGGPSIQEECNRIGPIEVGDAVLTNGGNLKAKYVIHAAGPVYGEGDEETKLAKATYNSLELAKRKTIGSIAFPAISTGIFHFPIKKCSEVMLSTAMDHLERFQFPHTIIFCLFDNEAYSVFDDTLTRLAESITTNG